jgi:hypothetical protein
LILYNKIKGLKRMGNKRMFQYEKPGQMGEGEDQFLFSRPYFFIFRHNVVRGKLSILELKFLL